MHILVKYNDASVGVFPWDSLFMQPLARRLASRNINKLKKELAKGITVVYQDWDGYLIEFKKVAYYES